MEPGANSEEASRLEPAVLGAIKTQPVMTWYDTSRKYVVCGLGSQMSMQLG